MAARPAPSAAEAAPPGATLTAGEALRDGAERRRALVERSALVRHTAASRLAAHEPLPEGAVIGEGTGTRFGLAVHRVLEVAPLDPSWTGVDEAARAAQEEFALADEAAPAVAAAVRAALTCAAVAAAGGHRSWREVFVATDVDGMLIEGFIDLLVETDEGLWVVDWKTDRVGDDGAVALAGDRYRPQVAAYALTAAAVTGQPVVRTTLVFCGDGVLREVDLTGDDLAAAVAEVRERLSAAAAPPARALSPTAGSPSPEG